MVGYDEAVYREVLGKAVSNIEELNKAVDEICDQGYKNLYLMGSGGTYSMASPVTYLLKRTPPSRGIGRLLPSSSRPSRCRSMPTRW